MIPLFHDFTGETVLIFGGGSVGARKARRFAQEADVVVVSPEFADASFGGADQIREAPDTEGVEEWIARTEPALVVAATNDADLNDTIEQAARESNALVNRADQSGDVASHDADSVVVPATVRDGDVTVAISTSGQSPALSKHLRQEFEEEFAGVGELAREVARVRRDLKAREVPPAERRDAVRAVVNSGRVWKALDSRACNLGQVVDDVISNNTGDSS